MSDKDLIQTTREYYDSKDADEFYHEIWGGEDIHIGIYSTGQESIKDASRNTILKMTKRLPSIKKGTKILDIGSGYGGAARFLAEKYKCQVDCLNLSETENQRNLKKTKAADLEKLISVTTGNFEQIPFDQESYDIVWSQDALLHSNKKLRVFQEVSRVLKPGGHFLFTDPMQSNDCPAGVLNEVLGRIHLEEMGSFNLYKRLARRTGLEQVFTKEMSEQLTSHYSKVLETLQKRYEEVAKKSKKTYLDKMMQGLQHWIDAGEKGYLTWGILQFQKRNA